LEVRTDAERFDYSEVRMGAGVRAEPGDHEDSEVRADAGYQMNVGYQMNDGYHEKMESLEEAENWL
jgi:hypothetical protein